MTLVRSSLLLLLAIPLAGAAQDIPKSRPFSLMARAGSFIGYQPNRPLCGVTPTSIGAAGNDHYNACLWPAGTSNRYLFSSGLQIAGIVGAGNQAWAGDTSGAFLYDSKGTTEHGEALTPVWQSSNSRDLARWPDQARVPGGIASIFRPEDVGRTNVSDDDAWSLAWDGNAGLRNGRTHPLGVLVETRLLGWNYPQGNEDIQYIAYTLFNVTATDPGAYAAARPELRSRLIETGRRFHASVDSTFGIALPPSGYTIDSLFVAIGADADVGTAGTNYSSINLPLSTQFTYDRAFSIQPGWEFGLKDHGPPFFSGAGFFGIKLLQSPEGGNQVRLFSVLSGGSGAGLVSPPQNVFQLYRFLSGSLAPASGDQPCNTGNPQVTHICYIKNDAPHDSRTFMSAAGGTLAPGESKTFVVAYIYAAPSGACPAPCDVHPGNTLWMSDPARHAIGVNQADSIAGYRGYADLNSDGVVQGGELRTVPRSLLAKAQMAQALFDSKFLLPQAPVNPDFFLIPGDNQVTVLWKPSESETLGDPYFASANQPRTVGPAGTIDINPLYDPNYRQFDVEGYRVWRSRTSDLTEATLLAQFDYAGTVIRDYTGRINPRQTCAPDLGIRTGCPTLDSLVPGEPLTHFTEIPLLGWLIQLRDGWRTRSPDGIAFALQADTLGGEQPDDLCLCDFGVPFSYTDSTAHNGFTYYYAVTAYDVNSLQSGPQSLESSRRPKRARPARPAANVELTGGLTVTLEGRGKALDPERPGPELDQGTGRFSGPFPPANAWTGTALNFVRELYVGEQEARLHLDSVSLGQTGTAVPGIPVQYHFTVTVNGAVQQLTLPIQQEGVAGLFVMGQSGRRLTFFSPDSTSAARYGGTADPLLFDFGLRLPSSAVMGEWGRYAANFSPNSVYNGIRWFDGPSPERNETMPHPNGQNCRFGVGCAAVPGFDYGNAGRLTGVTTVYMPIGYVMINNQWRDMSESQSGARRAADYNVYWGGGGLIDSVVDVTHNVLVPFSPRAGGTWGILNTSGQGAGGFDGRPAVLTPTDWTCVEPFRSGLTRPGHGFFPCTSPAPFALSQRAELGVIAFSAGDNQSLTDPGSVRNPSNLSLQPGFSLYISGTISQFGLEALPGAGTVWSVRDYVGFISSSSPTSHFFISGLRPLTAVGVDVVVRAAVQNRTLAARDGDLRRVHTVPDPFYFENQFEEGQGVRFVNLPVRATIRIYSSSGVLIRVLDHQPAARNGDTFWNLKTRNGQRVASGVYFYHVEAQDARRVGRMTVVNYTN